MTYKEIQEWNIEVKPGDKIKVYSSFLQDIGKIHIMYVLDSVYLNRKLIVYRIWGRHKQWWHEMMCDDMELKIMIDKANTHK